MFKRRLPQTKTYIPGPGRCIYCPPEKPTTEDLGREHIIARKLGGRLILHRASCRKCEELINREIETPVLKRHWLSVRTHLGLPTENPVSTLPLARFEHSGENLPTNLSGIRYEPIPVSKHPFIYQGITFEPPGILTNRPLSLSFNARGIQFYGDGQNFPAAPPGEKVAILNEYSPDLTCRLVAKIAHGAAVAELGIDSFEPYLPDVIAGRTPYISHYIGNTLRAGHERDALHEITLQERNGLLIANVQLFAKLGLRPFQAVVGRLLSP